MDKHLDNIRLLLKGKQLKLLNTILVNMQGMFYVNLVPKIITGIVRPIIVFIKIIVSELVVAISIAISCYHLITVTIMILVKIKIISFKYK